MKEQKQSNKKHLENQIEQLEQKLNDKEKIIEDHVNTLKRVQAEFENYMKRVEKEKQMIEIHSQHKIFAELLKIVDAFEAAIYSLQKQQGNEEIIKGIKMIYTQFTKFLEQHSVKKIDTKEQQLDPFKHEVLKKVESEKEENCIIEEIQKGYTFHDHVLRPSRVIISDGKKEVKNHNSEVTQNE